MNIKDMMTSFYDDESGVTAIEYAIVIAGIAGVCLVIFGSNGPVAQMLNSVFSKLKASLDGMIDAGSAGSGGSW